MNMCLTPGDKWTFVTEGSTVWLTDCGTKIHPCLIIDSGGSGGNRLEKLRTELLFKGGFCNVGTVFKKAGIDPVNIAVNGRNSFFESNGGNGTGGIFPDAGKRQDLLIGPGKFSHETALQSLWQRVSGCLHGCSTQAPAKAS